MHTHTIGKLHSKFLQCQNMINHKSRTSKKRFCLPLTWQCRKAMQKIKNTLVGIFSSLIFFALLNNSHCYALRTVLCTTEEYWKGLLTKAPRRRSQTTNFVVVFSCVALTTTADSALLSELSRKIALLWTSTLKLLCWKKFFFAIDLQKKKLEKSTIFLL